MNGFIIITNVQHCECCVKPAILQEPNVLTKNEMNVCPICADNHIQTIMESVDYYNDALDYQLIEYERQERILQTKTVKTEQTTLVLNWIQVKNHSITFPMLQMKATHETNTDTFEWECVSPQHQNPAGIMNGTPWTFCEYAAFLFKYFALDTMRLSYDDTKDNILVSFLICEPTLTLICGKIQLNAPREYTITLSKPPRFYCVIS